MNVWGNVKKVTLGGFVVGAMMFASTFTVTGCLTDNKKDSTTTPTDTTHHTALPTATTLSVGAQGHATYGSVIDIDSKSAWLSAAANAAQSDIDLVLLFYTGSFHLEDAVMAKASGVANSINLTNSYDDTKIKHCDMVKISTAPKDQEDAKKMFDAATTKIHGSVIAKGDMFLVMSTGGKLALVTVSDIAGSDKAGAATINLQVNTI